VGVVAEGFAKVSLNACSHGKMLFLWINDKAKIKNKNKGKMKKNTECQSVILKTATNKAQNIFTR